MNTLFLVILFEYIGIPEDAAKIMAFMIYLIVCLLILGALISIINIGTYTKCIYRSQNRICTDLKPYFNGYKTAPLPLLNRTMYI